MFFLSERRVFVTRYESNGLLTFRTLSLVCRVVTVKATPRLGTVSLFVTLQSVVSPIHGYCPSRSWEGTGLYLRTELGVREGRSVTVNSTQCESSEGTILTKWETMTESTSTSPYTQPVLVWSGLDPVPLRFSLCAKNNIKRSGETRSLYTHRKEVGKLYGLYDEDRTR